MPAVDLIVNSAVSCCYILSGSQLPSQLVVNYTACELWQKCVNSLPKIVM